MECARAPRRLEEEAELEFDRMGATVGSECSENWEEEEEEETSGVVSPECPAGSRGERGEGRR